MENTQIDAQSLLNEGAQIAADLTKRCMVQAGQISILTQQIRELQEQLRKAKETGDRVIPIKT